MMFKLNTNFSQAKVLNDLKEAWDVVRAINSLVGTQYCNVQNVFNIYAETKSETEVGEMNS